MKPRIKQMFKSFFLGAYATIADYVIFTILNYFVLVSFRIKSFHFGPFNYEVTDGGLCTFLSMAISYIVGQVINYFVQRKFAFNANEFTNPRRFVQYIISTLIVYMIILYIPGLIGAPINRMFGFAIGSLISKSIATFVGFLIQYPINKYLIFKKNSK